MIVHDQQYDEQAPAMRDGAVPALTWELAGGGAFPVIAVVRLPEEVAWPRDAAKPGVNWRFLIPARRDLERPALVRLELTFSDAEPVAVLWTILAAEDFTVLSFIGIADRVGFHRELRSEPERIIYDLGLDRLDAFRVLTESTRSPMVLNALSEYVQQRGADGR